MMRVKDKLFWETYKLSQPKCCCESKECDCDKRWLKVERK